MPPKPGLGYLSRTQNQGAPGTASGGAGQVGLIAAPGVPAGAGSPGILPATNLSPGTGAPPPYKIPGRGPYAAVQNNTLGSPLPGGVPAAAPGMTTAGALTAIGGGGGPVSPLTPTAPVAAATAAPAAPQPTVGPSQPIMFGSAAPPPPPSAGVIQSLGSNNNPTTTAPGNIDVVDNLAAAKPTEPGTVGIAGAGPQIGQDLGDGSTLQGQGQGIAGLAQQGIGTPVPPNTPPGQPPLPPLGGTDGQSYAGQTFVEGGISPDDFTQAPKDKWGYIQGSDDAWQRQRSDLPEALRPGIPSQNANGVGSNLEANRAAYLDYSVRALLSRGIDTQGNRAAASENGQLYVPLPQTVPVTFDFGQFIRWFAPPGSPISGNPDLEGPDPGGGAAIPEDGSFIPSGLSAVDEFNQITLPQFRNAFPGLMPASTPAGGRFSDTSNAFEQFDALSGVFQGDPFAIGNGTGGAATGLALNALLGQANVQQGRSMESENLFRQAALRSTQGSGARLGEQSNQIASGLLDPNQIKLESQRRQDQANRQIAAGENAASNRLQDFGLFGNAGSGQGAAVALQNQSNLARQGARDSINDFAFQQQRQDLGQVNNLANAASERTAVQNQALERLAVLLQSPQNQQTDDLINTLFSIGGQASAAGQGGTSFLEQGGGALVGSGIGAAGRIGAAILSSAIFKEAIAPTDTSDETALETVVDADASLQDFRFKGATKRHKNSIVVEEFPRWADERGIALDVQQIIGDLTKAVAALTRKVEKLEAENA